MCALSEQQRLALLTPRELEVLLMVCKGMRNVEISAMLQISKWTTHDHLQTIFEKLCVSSRAEAAVIAAHCGLV